MTTPKSPPRVERPHAALIRELRMEADWQENYYGSRNAVNLLLAAADALEASDTERARLRQALGANETWTTDAVVALAEAYKSDSEDVDAYAAEAAALRAEIATLKAQA